MTSVIDHFKPNPMTELRPFFRYFLWRMQESRCCYCGIRCLNPFDRRANEPTTATIEHLIPKSKGGSDYLNNLLMACKRCNTRRGCGRRLRLQEQFR